MLEKTGNIWESGADIICVTTNGIVKKDGRLVMGAGIARVARDKYPDFDYYLGECVRAFGNKPHLYSLPDAIGMLCSFPTKHHWKEDSDLNLIEESCKELVQITNKTEEVFGRPIRVALTRPGCGCGSLWWEDVKPVIERYLDERFEIWTK